MPSSDHRPALTSVRGAHTPSGAPRCTTTSRFPIRTTPSVPASHDAVASTTRHPRGPGVPRPTCPRSTSGSASNPTARPRATAGPPGTAPSTGRSPVRRGWSPSTRAVDTELGVIKTGKEADVHLVERSVPGTDRRTLMAAKRYRDRRAPHVPPRRRLPRGPARAPVPRDAGDGEPHRRSAATCCPGSGRAPSSRRSPGSGPTASRCPIRCSAAAPSCCWSSSATTDGTAAPRLAQLRPDADELCDLWHQLVDALVGLARHGLTHGDLSAYNLLVHDGRLVLIDLPQVVDVVGNPQGPEFLARDVRRIGEWFAARGLPGEVGDPDALLAELRVELGMPRKRSGVGPVASRRRRPPGRGARLD